MKFVLGDHMVITWKLLCSRRDLAFDGAKMKFIVGSPCPLMVKQWNWDTQLTQKHKNDRFRT